jgi:large exoprotein involved in heme utilization and adhesion
LLNQEDGGAINITANVFTAIENSDILATSVSGKGGDITIDAPFFLADIFANGGPTPASETNFEVFRSNGRVDISASSVSGTSGRVSVPNLEDVENSLAELGSSFVSADQVVAGSCLVLRQVDIGQESSFTVSGVEGLSPTPYDQGQIGFSVNPLLDTQRRSTSTEQSEINFVAQAARTEQKTDSSLREANRVVLEADGRVLLAADNNGPREIRSARSLICP